MRVDPRRSGGLRLNLSITTLSSDSLRFVGFVVKMEKMDDDGGIKGG